MIEHERLQKLSGIIDRAIVSDILSRFRDETLAIQGELDLDDHSFKLASQKESIISRIISYRVVNSAHIKHVTEKIKDHLSLTNDWIINPLIYLRKSTSELNVLNTKGGFFYTEPHFDRAEADFISIWLPLVETSAETGTLCYFDQTNQNISDKFPKLKSTTKNTLDIASYLRTFEKFDPFLKESFTEVHCKVGDVIVFGPNCLHGATKGEGRVSVNFQMIHRSVLKWASKNAVAKFLLADSNLDAINILNLLALGDVKGAARVSQSQKRHLDSHNQIVSNQVILTSPILDQKLTKRMHWKSEMGWISSLFPDE